jgi:hypothetical protein
MKQRRVLYLMYLILRKCSIYVIMFWERTHSKLGSKVLRGLKGGSKL